MSSDPTLITRRRMLPAPGRVDVKAGDRVDHDTIIGEAEYSFRMPHFMNVARLLGERVRDLTRDHFTVSEGDEVTAGDTVARFKRGWGFMGESREASAPVSGVVEMVLPELGLLSIRAPEAAGPGRAPIPVSASLRCRADEMIPYLRVAPGDRVQQGQMLAVREDVPATLVARSPHDGVVDTIDSSEGTVVLRRHRGRQVVRAFIPGHVQRVIPGRGAVISSQGSVIRGVFGAGGERVGVMAVKDTHALRAVDIEQGHRNSVLAVRGHLSLDALLKAHEAGVQAVVGASALAADMVHLMGEDLGRGVTGSESMGLAVVLTEGFGRLEMDDELWALLSRHRGSTACVRAETQMRAGVIRPEVILPGADSTLSIERGSGELRVGATVRIVREPGFMQRGIVEGLMGASDVGNGIRAPALRVALEDGSVLTVLQANVEVIY